MGDLAPKCPICTSHIEGYTIASQEEPVSLSCTALRWSVEDAIFAAKGTTFAVHVSETTDVKVLELQSPQLQTSDEELICNFIAEAAAGAFSRRDDRPVVSLTVFLQLVPYIIFFLYFADPYNIIAAISK
jgi:hypothetical protein